MSLDPKYQHHSDKALAKLVNLDALEQVAAAAGHGYVDWNAPKNAGWTNVTFDEDNVRPSYDLNHIHTFSPDLVRAMLFELSEARKRIATLEGQLESIEESMSV